MSSDKIYLSFLENSFALGKQLEAESDVVRILDTRGTPASAFLLQFCDVDYLIQKDASAPVEISKEPVLVDVYFPPDYLRSVDAQLYLRVVSVLNPYFFHPNVRMPFGWICLGHDFLPGTLLSDLIFHVYEIISYQNMTVDERDAFNPEACRYLRRHPEALAALTRAPLRRRQLNVEIKVENLD